MLNDANQIFFTQLPEPDIEYEIHFYDDRTKSATAGQWFSSAHDGIKSSYSDVRDALKALNEYDGKYAHMPRRIVALHRTTTVVDWVDTRT